MEKKIFLVFFLFFIIFEHVDSQESDENIIIGEYQTFQSKILGENFKYVVRLPEGYENNYRQYPVLYLMNAQMTSTFSIAVGTLENLEFEMIPSLILVGISNTGRAGKYLPVQAEGPSDQANTFLRFLTEELILIIDNEYRTENFRILMGQSNSALFVLYTLLSKPEVFNAYFAASPSLGWCLELIKDKLHSFISDTTHFSPYLYINYGSRDYQDLVIEPTKSFIETIEETSPTSLSWKLDVLENDGHVPVTSLNNGLLSLFPDFLIIDELKNQGLEAVDKHYLKLTKKYGFHFQTPEEIIFHMSYILREQKQYKDAIDMFKVVVSRYPNSFRSYFYLADTYEKIGDKKSAKKYFIKTIELNPDFQPAHKKLKMLRNQ